MIDNWFSYEIEELKEGFSYDEKKEAYLCLVCGKSFSLQEIFPIQDHFYQAKFAVAHHIKEAHQGILPLLFEEDKKNIGLTDVQKEILNLVSCGYTDGQIAKITNVAASTIRHTRFTLKERAKQAKLYLALFELATTRGMESEKNDLLNLVEIHANAKMVDERYALTVGEEEKIINSCFRSLEPLKLKTFSTKEKRKLVILRKIITLFSQNRTYTEKEVSEILKSVYSDFVTLRRYLIEYGFMERSADGSSYWRK